MNDSSVLYDGRGTNMAVYLAHDVAADCNSRGSSVFMCMLDAQGDFDSIPPPVLFQKTIVTMSDCSWRLLYTLKVYLKLNGLCGNINIYQRVPYFQLYL